MSRRRRYASRAELLELFAAREPGVDWSKVLDALDAEGAEVLVKIEVAEEV